MTDTANRTEDVAPKVRFPVTDEQVLRVYANKDCYRVIQKRLKGWAKQLDDDTLSACADDAIRKVLSYHDENRPGGIKLTTALHREVLNVCRNAWDTLQRARKRQSTAFDFALQKFRKEISPGSSRYSSHEKMVEAQDFVHFYLQDLAAGYRQIIQLHYFEDLSFSEISQVLKVSADKCRERFACAMRALRMLAESAA